MVIQRSDSIVFNKKIKGYIGSYRLSDWWLTILSEEERVLIVNLYKPLGFPPSTLTEYDITKPNQSVTMFLINLSGWLSVKKHRKLIEKILDKAQEETIKTNDIYELHCLYGCLINFYYKDRANPESFEQAVLACRKQIAISTEVVKQHKERYRSWPLGTHNGYEQLAIILEKQKDYSGAIAICYKAIEDGWAGDWEKRISRCKIKEEKK